MSEEKPYNWVLVQDLGQSFNEKENRTEMKAIFRVENNFSSIPNPSIFQFIIDEAFESAMNHFLKGRHPNDVYSVYIEHSDLEKPISIRKERVSDLDKHSFLGHLSAEQISFISSLKFGDLKIRVLIYDHIFVEEMIGIILDFKNINHYIARVSKQLSFNF
jgi:hypothetical protein